MGPDATGQRADTWLSGRFNHWSRTEVARLIARGEIRAPNRTLKASSRLVADEPLFIRFADQGPAGPPPPTPPVLYEDERVIVVDKPAGLLCHPAGRAFSYGVVGLVRDARPDHQIDLVHRLDRETSGALVLAKDKAANAFLKERLRRGEGLFKEYLAIARGVIPWEQRLVDAPIGHAPGSEIRIRRGIAPDGRPARTSFRVLQRMEAHTLVACQLHTGRTHQIRVHLEHTGFPLLGDKMYGQPDAVFLHHLDHGPDELVRQAVGFPRHALHAWRIRMPHPDGQGVIEVEAPLAADLRVIVDGDAPGWTAPPSGL